MERGYVVRAFIERGGKGVRRKRKSEERRHMTGYRKKIQGRRENICINL